jgi:hypothetical protein
MSVCYRLVQDKYKGFVAVSKMVENMFIKSIHMTEAQFNRLWELLTRYQ